MSSITNEHRPSTSYSEHDHTPRHAPSYPPMSSAEYTSYQQYSYPIPQTHGHGHSHGQHQSPYQYASNPMTLPQPLPSCSSTVDFGDFLNAMPPSASGFGTNLENYQVISGSKHSRGSGSVGGHAAGESMSRGSSSSGSADLVETPQPIEDCHNEGEADAEGMDEDSNE
jgi:hypothetical protein